MHENTQSREQWMEQLRGFGAVIEGGEISRFDSEPGQPPMLTPLLHLACLEISGEDAEAFLDGQFSAAIRQLSAGHWILTAWHDPKGRARTLLHVQRHAEGYTCLMPRTLMGEILPKLRMFVLRSKVTIDDLSAHKTVLGVHSPEQQRPDGFQPLSGAPDWALACAGFDEIAGSWERARAAGFEPAGYAAWRRQEILTDIPSLRPATSGRFLPQFLGLERFEGLNFKKGCYIGQEVIARTHYLGKVKQYLAKANCPEAPEPGCDVRDGDGRRLGHALDGAPTEEGSWLVQLVIRQDKSQQGLHLDQAGKPALELA
ncbi:folate-binding protein YgfZ [Natronospira proteinivora]|uniref:Folate-binding protein YgfZ n=1 Tax=Natronospira proteinivora TaxID=1807133 RepID=A0ABT1G5T4_9GAMM|nr:hypothetical protein [Natronospira proteinivora]MCP1726659.1 folate-binding protein YgfZ [Natronospira proteinivora]